MLGFIFVWIWCCTISHSSQIPNFKWSQSNTSILLTAYYDPSRIVRLKDQKQIKINKTDLKPKTRDHKIEKEWLKVNWNNFKLDLHLREDIVPSESWCKWKEDYVVCSLEKKDEHIFDYLMAREQIKLLKPYCTKDWEATVVGSAQDEYEFPESIKKISAKHLVTLKQKSKNFIVRGFYPWCSSCHEEQVVFEESVRDKRLRKRNMKFYIVDAREDREAGQAVNAQCDDHCQFIVYFNKKEYHVKGQSKKKDFVNEILLEIRDPYKLIKSEEKFQKLGKKVPLVIGYFDNFEGDEIKKFKETAQAMKREKTKFAILDKQDSKINWAKAATNGANRALLINGKQKYYFDGLSVKENNHFDDWVEVYSRDIFDEYKVDLREKFQTIDVKLPIVKIFVDYKPSDKLKRKMKEIAKKYSNKLIFLWYRDEYSHEMFLMGLQNHSLPAFGISTALGDDASYYAGAGIPTIESVKALCDAYLDGIANQTFKSEPNPGSWEGGVQKVVYNTFATEVEQSDINTVLLMHNNWSADADDARNTLTDLTEALHDDLSIKFCEFDYGANYWQYEKFGKDQHSSDSFLYFYYKLDGEARHKEITPQDSQWNIEDIVNLIVKTEFYEKFSEQETNFRNAVEVWIAAPVIGEKDEGESYKKTLGGLDLMKEINTDMEQLNTDLKKEL